MVPPHSIQSLFHGDAFDRNEAVGCKNTADNRDGLLLAWDEERVAALQCEVVVALGEFFPGKGDHNASCRFGVLHSVHQLFGILQSELGGDTFSRLARLDHGSQSILEFALGLFSQVLESLRLKLPNALAGEDCCTHVGLIDQAASRSDQVSYFSPLRKHIFARETDHARDLGLHFGPAHLADDQPIIRFKNWVKPTALLDRFAQIKTVSLYIKLTGLFIVDLTDDLRFVIVNLR